jgi:hypothetical protein
VVAEKPYKRVGIFFQLFTKKFRPMKRLFLLLCASALMFFSSCEKADVISYEIKYKLSKPTIGTTVFNTISYNDGTSVQTISNSSDDFTKTFAVKSGYNINFSVKGSITTAPNSTTPPIFLVSYELTEIKNGERTSICDDIKGLGSGKNGVYPIDVSFNKTFDGTTCK